MRSRPWHSAGAVIAHVDSLCAIRTFKIPQVHGPILSERFKHLQSANADEP